MRAGGSLDTPDDASTTDAEWQYAEAFYDVEDTAPTSQVKREVSTPNAGDTTAPVGTMTPAALELHPPLAALRPPRAASTAAGSQRPAKQSRGTYLKTTSDQAEMYHTILDSADANLNPRPAHLDTSALSQQVFVERPVLKRSKGSDRWLTSGGRKGASEVWISPQQGLRKRYGRVDCIARERHGEVQPKFAQFNLIRRANVDAPAEDVPGAGLWVLYPPTSETQAVPAVLNPADGVRVQSRTSLHHVEPSLLLRAGQGQSFISFEAEPTADSEDGIELGAIVRHGDGGIKLESTQGDVAEWHRVADGEPPLDEGDVVGFWHGRISRVTRRCEMLGVVTRKAVVEGSAPPAHERHLYDTVAYTGVIPVKVSNQQTSQACECPAPRAGYLLVPSGKNDGTALLVPPTDGVPRVGILLQDQEHARTGTDDWRLVQAVVVSPTETVAFGLPLVGRPGLRMLLQVGTLVILLLVGVADILGRAAGQQRTGDQHSSPVSGPACHQGGTLRSYSCNDVDCSDWTMQRNSVRNFSSCQDPAHRTTSPTASHAEYCCREWTCLPVDTPLSPIWSDEGAWKHVPGSLEFSEVDAEKVVNCDDGTGSMSSLISLSEDNRGCTGYSGIPYDFALSECERRCVIVDTCSGYTTYYDSRNSTTLCCFRVNQADATWSAGYSRHQLLAKSEEGGEEQQHVPVEQAAQRCYVRSQPFAAQPVVGYSIINRSGTTVSSLGTIGCASGYVPDDRTCCPRSPEATPAANCTSDGDRFILSGCAPRACQPFMNTIAPDFSDTSAARKFFHQYPASSRSLQDYLRSAPPAVALEALLDGVFDGDASKSGLGPYIVDRPEASTVPDLGTVGCVVGYKSQVDAQTLRRQRPTMVCDELPVSDPSTVEWAFGPTFYGQGCVPNDTCERAEPCADGNSDGGAVEMCAAEEQACRDATKTFGVAIAYNRKMCVSTTAATCRYCVTDDRLQTIDGEGAVPVKNCVVQ